MGRSDGFITTQDYNSKSHKWSGIGYTKTFTIRRFRGRRGKRERRKGERKVFVNNS